MVEVNPSAERCRDIVLQMLKILVSIMCIQLNNPACTPQVIDQNLLADERITRLNMDIQIRLCVKQLIQIDIKPLWGFMIIDL